MLIVVIVLLLLALISIVIILQPDEFRVVRNIYITAAAAAVFAHVNDLHKWQVWSPWAKLDPGAKNDFSGPDAGVDASLRWEGNHKVGTGRMTITDSIPAEKIVFRLEFEKPFKATNSAEFLFTQEDALTLVSWSMVGKTNFITKAMNLVMNCDRMVGSQFEKGLVDLKSIAEMPAR